MMEIIIPENATLEKEKMTLSLLEDMLEKDTNEKDKKYHKMAIEATKAAIKRLEGSKC